MLFKRILFYLLLILSLSQFNTDAAFFSSDMEKLVRAGRTITVQLEDGINMVMVKPNQDDTLYRTDDGQGFKLSREQLYILRVEEKVSSFMQIQVFASKNQAKANQVYGELIEQGYQPIEIVQEGEWFKVRVGHFAGTEQAEATKKQLEQASWGVWLVRKKESRSARIYLYGEQGQELFSGRSLYVNGVIELDDRSYNGQTSFLIREQGMEIVNSCSLAELISGIMETQLGQHNLLPDEEQLKAAAITYRTNVLAQLFNDFDWKIHFPEYKGNGNNKAIRDAVQATTGIILTENNQLFPLTQGQERVNSLVQPGDDYRSLLQRAKIKAELTDLTQLKSEEIKVDAEVIWGLRYQEIEQLTWWGPRVISILELDLERTGLSVEPVLAGGKIAGLADLNEMVTTSGALAGINGGYYHYSGRPLGLLMINGTIISEPIKARTAIGITGNNQILIDRVKWQGMIEDPTGKELLVISGVNRNPRQDETVIFNKYYGKTLPAMGAGTVQVTVLNQQIYRITTEAAGQENIPENGYIIIASGHPRKKLAEWAIGDQISYRDQYTPDWGGRGVVSAVGAGPRLIKDQRIAITSVEEGFQADIAFGLAPRSALGVTANNRLLLFTVDGRQPELSIGISLQELAEYMLNFGVVDGVNLDGGGSARMVVRGFTMNKPSAKRVISNGLLINIH